MFTQALDNGCAQSDVVYEMAILHISLCTLLSRTKQHTERAKVVGRLMLTAMSPT